MKQVTLHICSNESNKPSKISAIYYQCHEIKIELKFQIHTETIISEVLDFKLGYQWTSDSSKQVTRQQQNA